MIKNIRFLFFSIFCILISKYVYALSTSSYLISNIAFKESDFNTVFDQIVIDNNELNLNDYNKELISLMNLHKFSLANKIANKILKIDPLNQEALLVNFIINLKLNITDKLYLYKHDNKLISFVFFNKDKLKTKEEISEALVSIVEASYSEHLSIDEINYNYLLFYLSLSIFINPEYDVPWFLTGQYYQIMGKYEKIDYYYNQISSESSFYKQAQLNTALSYEKLFSFDKAEFKIKELIQQSNNDPDLIKILADFYRYNSFYDLAINQYTQLINNQTNNKWYIFYLRGICFERLNQWEYAERDFLKSLDLNPESPDVLNYLAYGWIEKNMNIDLSLSMLEKAYRDNPDSYYILDSLAWAHYKKNNFEFAAELMEKVIEMAPGEAISLDHLGDIYFSLKRNREAIFLWKQAKDLAEPEDNIIENIEKKLKVYYEG